MKQNSISNLTLKFSIPIFILTTLYVFIFKDGGLNMETIFFLAGILVGIYVFSYSISFTLHKIKLKNEDNAKEIPLKFSFLGYIAWLFLVSDFTNLVYFDSVSKIISVSAITFVFYHGYWKNRIVIGDKYFLNGLDIILRKDVLHYRIVNRKKFILILKNGRQISIIGNMKFFEEVKKELRLKEKK